MEQTVLTCPSLQILDSTNGWSFEIPKKCIHRGHDVTAFLASKGYGDVMTFIFQLNSSMLPRLGQDEGDSKNKIIEWKINDDGIFRPAVVQKLAALLQDLTSIIEDAPPDPGPRRFGNASFRKWYAMVEERLPNLLDQYLPKQVLQFRSTSNVSAQEELSAYLLGSFGSAQRLDYGTGHELSFLAFLACLWKLGAFPGNEDSNQERGIVVSVVEPYLELMRRLILTYTLEPAGSHGVWGLDDHFFIPYILGSAQFSPPLVNAANIVTEGSLQSAPNPADIVKLDYVTRLRKSNMYFGAIGFILDVKKGLFWEHSPILYDVSGVKAGWAKINKGMFKMYNAEVLSKFPVVQHFPFGSLLSWERDSNAKDTAATVHISNQPKTNDSIATPMPGHQPSLRDPRAQTAYPSTRRPDFAPGMASMQTTQAPWKTAAPPPSSTSSQKQPGPGMLSFDIPTKAPWTK